MRRRTPALPGHDRSQGNDRPITSTNETWMSPELHVMMLSKMNDPRSGEHTQKLTHVNRSEPDSRGGG